MRRALLLLALAVGPAAAQPVKTGLDVLRDSGCAALQGKRVGVITNQTGKDSAGRPIIELLLACGVRLEALFAPEHGFDGTAEARETVSSSTYRAGGRDLPIHSLYGGGVAGLRPKPEHLAGLDAVVFDIQDIGARFYTYAALMAMALEETAKAGVEFHVLDRPNPVNGEVVEGPLLRDSRWRSKIPDLPVTVRHGMTMGELALFHNAGVRHPGLHVVRMEGWRRAMWFDQTGLPWTPTSLNMPDLAAATLYPGVACLEFSNVSVGRGTPTPFGWIGAPWLDANALVRRLNAARLKGIAFAAEERTPSKSTHAGQRCPGVRLEITDRGALRPLAVFAHLVTALRDQHPKDFDLRWDRSFYLIGNEEFRRLYESGASARRIAGFFDEESREFRLRRREFLLYP